MTDVDRLLTEDGARWRAVQPLAREPDPDLLDRPRPSRWQPVAAAAAVAAVAASAVTAAAVRSPAPTPVTVATAPSPGPVVRDGDRVTGQVLVSAMPGRPVRACGQLPTEGGGRSATGKALPGKPVYCANGLTLVGVDLDRLANRETLGGTVIGRGDLTGTYRAGTVTVTSQRTPASAPGKTPRPAEPLPPGCPAPAGGWPARGTLTDAQMARVQAYVNKFDHVFGAMWVGSPRAPQWEPQVIAVSTVISVTGATEAIRRVYDGPLCVVKVTHRREEMVSARGNLSRMVNSAAYSNRYGLNGGGGAELNDARGEPYTELGVLVWTANVEELRFFLGAGVVQVRPSLRKVD